MKKVDKAFLNETKKKIEEKLRMAEETRGDVDSYVNGSSILTKERVLLMKQTPEIEEYIRDLKSLRNSLSISGMMDVVYGLPRLRLMCENSSIDATFLMLSGIKVNAKKKKEETCKKLDLKYLELERRMALYIDDDLKIKPEFLTEFVNLYYKYLKTFFIEKEVDMKGEERYRGYVSLPVVVYTMYRERSVMLSFKGMVEAASLFNKLIETGFTIGGAVRMVVRNLLEAKDENLFIIIIPDEEEEIRPLKRKVHNDKVQAMKEENPLDKYMENGRVVASCSLKEFSEILEQTDLADNLKLEYYAQMRNFNNKKAKEQVENELARLRADYLFEGEIELYSKGKLIPEASGIIDDIDTAFLLIREGVTPEERDDLIEEINTLIESLREMLVPQSQEKEEEVPNLVYYLEERNTNGEVVKTASLLSTILINKKDDNKAIMIELNKLLNGNFGRDKEFYGDNLPYRVFYKGRDVKLFYLVISGTIVVIDAFKGEAAFKKIQKIINSVKFNDFIDELQKFISRGGRPSAICYTSLIKKELLKSQESKKMRFTQVDVNKTN